MDSRVCIQNYLFDILQGNGRFKGFSVNFNIMPTNLFDFRSKQKFFYIPQ